MSNPYGPPPNGGQQGPGQYGAPGGPSWGAPQGGSPYGAPAPTYGQAPGPQGGPGFGQGAPGQGAPGQNAPGQGGPGQWGGPPPPAAAPPKAPKVPRPPRAPGSGADLTKILPLVSGVLGLIAFIAGFLSAYTVGDGDTSVSVKVFAGGPSYLPILLLIVGLLAVAPLIPGGKKFTLVIVLLSVAGFLGAIGSLLTKNLADVTGTSSSTGFGLILLLIVSILLVGSTGFGWLTESGILKPGAPASSSRPSAAPAPSPYGAPTPAPNAPAAPGGYGGYPAGGYQPPADGYQPYGQSSAEPATSGHSAPSPTAAPATGSTPAVEPPGYGGSYSQGPSTGQHGRDDGPPPDVTQQVRF